jgi:hypothetical protein
VGGAIVGALSFTFGMIFVMHRDYVTLDVKPGVAALSSRLAPAPAPRAATPSPSGLTAVLRF